MLFRSYRFGHPLGSKTLFRDVRLLPPGSMLTYDLASHFHKVDFYWNLLDLFPRIGARAANGSVDDVVSSLADAIAVRANDRDRLGLSLSGGLDSRAILAALWPRTTGLPTYTLGQPGCMDQRVAFQLARIAKTLHTFLPIGKEQLAGYETMAREMLRLSEGHYHPHECTEMVALEYFKRSPFKILLRGHGGEIAKAAEAYPVRYRAEATSLAPGAPTLDFIFQKANIVIRDADQSQLFASRLRSVMIEGPYESLRKSCGSASAWLQPADLCIYYYTNEFVRRLAVASLQIFRSQVEIRMPFLDEIFLEHLLKLPIASRTDGTIQIALIKRFMPPAVKVPNSNTGAPLDAGPIRLFLWDHMNVLLKRLNVPGFRHYTKFHEWYRSVFREAIRDIVFSERCRQRNLYDMQYLEAVFQNHISGRRDYGNLLGTIAGLELWFQQFVD